MNFFFVSDLHGSTKKCNKLFLAIEAQKPEAVFIGGDITKSGLGSLVSKSSSDHYFISDFLIKQCKRLKELLGNKYPDIFIILGNDDLRTDEADLEVGESMGLWYYINQRMVQFKEYNIYGYAFIPPSPFLLKDFEKYDVSQYVDPGCVPPEQGFFSFEVNKALLKRDTIKKDLEKIENSFDLSKSIMLFHSPPYQTNLDRADLDGKFYEYVPLDVHIGSIAIKKFIQKNQPKVTLHGHVHESARITGNWKQLINGTIAMSAAHDGSELSLIEFNPDEPEKAIRRLI